MISKADLVEVKNRDFLKVINHYRDADSIMTKLVFGERIKEEVFLSIVVPVYNHPIEFIRRAIQSVLKQKCSYSYEILVLDDYILTNGQTKTEKYIRQLNDSRITYYKNEKNLGVFANWNRGIELSRGKWVTILHTDDFFKSNFMENMKKIIDSNPNIDQLACNYKLLDFKKNDIDPNSEYQSIEKKTILRKVKASEYLYEMKTSVKGSLYKRDKLIEIGGFRSQGDGIGLDDYPLMLRFAHYFNTYLIEDVLYLDSWGYNDSLNTKHWYPELVENYYMWLYFAKKEHLVARKIYEKNAKYLLMKRAFQYKDGSSWVGIPIEIDIEQLKEDCEINTFVGNKFEEKIVGFLSRVFNYIKKHPLEKKEITLSKEIPISTLE